MDEVKQTSKQWYKYYNRTVGLIIANYEGWGKDLKQSFEKDLVTQDEFLDMLKKSTYTKNE
mgnify:FL=1